MLEDQKVEDGGLGLGYSFEWDASSGGRRWEMIEQWWCKCMLSLTESRGVINGRFLCFRFIFLFFSVPIPHQVHEVHTQPKCVLLHYFPSSSQKFSSPGILEQSNLSISRM